MSVAKRILRNVCISEPKDPSKAMKASNEILASYNVNMFVTVLLIYYDLETGKFKYANGGHNEALLLNPSGEFRYFGCLENAVIGFLPELEYKSAEGIINPGDTLVLYTDGITEANAPSEEEFGETRLAEFIVKNKDCKADQIVKGLIQHVHEFEQGNQFDDITVLVFKRER